MLCLFASAEAATALITAPIIRDATGDDRRSSFSNGEITVAALDLNGGDATLNLDRRLGISSDNDRGTAPGEVINNGEALVLTFEDCFGLSLLAFDIGLIENRAPLTISGFSADPGLSAFRYREFGTGPGNSTLPEDDRVLLVSSYENRVLSFFFDDGSSYNVQFLALSFENPGASVGQELTLSGLPDDGVGGNVEFLRLEGIAYDEVKGIPEPTAVLLLAFSGLGLLKRRRA